MHSPAVAVNGRYLSNDSCWTHDNVVSRESAAFCSTWVITVNKRKIELR